MRKKNSPQYHSQKHPNTRGPHPHIVTPLANYEIHTNSVTLKRREICCVDKMGRERKIGKSRKEKEVRRRFREKGAAIWKLKRRVLRFVVTWERKKR
jgi:hypothetical protein